LSDTKGHALSTMNYLDPRVALDTPINVHFTGCPNSCDQHYIGDIGLLGTKVANGEDSEVEGYHVYLGGSYGEQRELAREILRDVPHQELPRMLEQLLQAYLKQRSSAAESFSEFARRHSSEALRALLEPSVAETL
jgi:ferredoxin-nitrite reductase